MMSATTVPSLSARYRTMIDVLVETDVVTVAQIEAACDIARLMGIVGFEHWTFVFGVLTGMGAQS